MLVWSPRCQTSLGVISSSAGPLPQAAVALGVSTARQEEAKLA